MGNEGKLRPAESNEEVRLVAMGAPHCLQSTGIDLLVVG